MLVVPATRGGALGGSRARSPSKFMMGDSLCLRIPNNSDNYYCSSGKLRSNGLRWVEKLKVWIKKVIQKFDSKNIWGPPNTGSSLRLGQQLSIVCATYGML